MKSGTHDRRTGDTFFRSWKILPYVFVAVLALANARSLEATTSDRFVAYFPRAMQDDGHAGLERNSMPPDTLSVSRFGVVDAEPESNDAWSVPGWTAYAQLWSEFHDDPSNPTLRQYLGLPIGRGSDASLITKLSRGRSAPRWLGWPVGTYAHVETPHLQIFSHANREQTIKVAEDLERVFWVWSQIFFPLWDRRNQVSLHLNDFKDGSSITQLLNDRPARLRPRKKLRIVLFRDSDEYIETLRKDVPGIEASTGFYADERRTSFFFPSDDVDAEASQRHELIHQLFRESTLSGLDDRFPGETDRFWLVEGIAGYFESLVLAEGIATVGGWDSPRLQFARHRVFRRRQVVAFDSLANDGRRAVQTGGDLGTFYAFAIAYTHAVMDGPSSEARRWLMQTLAELYEV
ncbi:MAG: hypothetical protein AAGJ83_11585, partial [Planctomycetota bacterium]